MAASPMMATSGTFSLFLIIFVVVISGSKASIASIESTVNPKMEDSVLDRLNQLEIENRRQNEKIGSLELNTKNLQDKTEHLEEKLKLQAAESVFSSTFTTNMQTSTLGLQREKRPFRLLPAHLNDQQKAKRIGNVVPRELSPPSSCQDLNGLGQTLNGFYMVKSNNRGFEKNTSGGEIKSVYCDFQNSFLPSSSVPPVLEKPLGFLHITSLPNQVAFLAQRNSKFDNDGIVLFTSLLLNDGGAMDLKTVVFTAPIAGTYSFHFNGLGAAGGLYVYLMKKYEHIGSSFYDGQGGRHGTLALSTVLKLATGDRIYLSKQGLGFLQDNDNHQTLFCGLLIA